MQGDKKSAQLFNVDHQREKIIHVSEIQKRLCRNAYSYCILYITFVLSLRQRCKLASCLYEREDTNVVIYIK